MKQSKHLSSLSSQNVEGKGEMKLLVKNCSNQERTGHRQFSQVNDLTTTKTLHSCIKEAAGWLVGAVAQVLTRGCRSGQSRGSSLEVESLL